MIFERTVAEIAGDYAVLVSESGTRTEVALALLPDGIREGTVLICENTDTSWQILPAKQIDISIIANPPALVYGFSLCFRQKAAGFTASRPPRP